MRLKNNLERHIRWALPQFKLNRPPVHLRGVTVPLSLLQQLANDEHVGRCAIACDVILGSCCPGNKRRCRVLDLHFVQKHIPVLCDLDVARPRDQPAWVEVQIS